MHAPQARQSYIDWLRVLIVMSLIPVHSAMIFVDYFWMIKNPEKSERLWLFVVFFAQWRMPLLFLLSGLGTWYALKRRSAREYARERVTRLFLPLVFGILVLVPPQIYLERVNKGQSRWESFAHFVPEAWSGVYPVGNLSWHHLWFLAYLLTFSLLMLPLFLHLRAERSARLREGIANFLQRPGAVLLLGVPIVLSETLLRPRWPGLQNLVDDWANFALYLTAFVYGFVFAAQERALEAIDGAWKTALTLGVVATLAFYSIPWSGHSPTPAFSLEFCTYAALRGANGWLWMVAALGAARRFLNVRNRVISYASEGTFPFYLLHQTVIVVVGFQVVQWQMGVPLKFAIICLASLVGTFACYEIFVRHWRWVRPLFGLKSERKETGGNSRAQKKTDDLTSVRA